jgi:hypothetical protein
MELAADERAIGDESSGGRASYGRTLVELATLGQSRAAWGAPLGGPLGFEVGLRGGVAERVRALRVRRRLPALVQAGLVLLTATALVACAAPRSTSADRGASDEPAPGGTAPILSDLPIVSGSAGGADPATVLWQIETYATPGPITIAEDGSVVRGGPDRGCAVLSAAGWEAANRSLGAANATRLSAPTILTRVGETGSITIGNDDGADGSFEGQSITVRGRSGPDGLVMGLEVTSQRGGESITARRLDLAVPAGDAVVMVAPGVAGKDPWTVVLARPTLRTK